MSPVSKEVLDQSTTYNFGGLSTDEIKDQLTKSIKLNLKQITASKMLGSSYALVIAKSLERLEESPLLGACEYQNRHIKNDVLLLYGLLRYA
ncbi:hypothetical protein BDR26DRAFT_852945 [Obelidium mucronatum]|nr:hypothetical protein BDR26DRAFT_852945 [Obelidium mucronatum]